MTRNEFIAELKNLGFSFDSDVKNLLKKNFEENDTLLVSTAKEYVSMAIFYGNKCSMTPPMKFDSHEDALEAVKAFFEIRKKKRK